MSSYLVREQVGHVGEAARVPGSAKKPGYSLKAEVPENLS